MGARNDDAMETISASVSGDGDPELVWQGYTSMVTARVQQQIEANLRCRTLAVGDMTALVQRAE